MTTMNELGLSHLSCQVPPHLQKLHHSHLLTPSTQRIQQFLARSKQQGKNYRPGTSRYPTFKRLAAYCQCSTPVISRIAAGTKTSINLETLQLLETIACICPPALPGEHYREMDARMSDADGWLMLDIDGRPELIDALVDGIRQRLELSCDLVI